MSGGLSENEIGRLVEAAAAGDLPDEAAPARARRRRVRPYDFSRPIKVDRDQMRDLNRLHSSFCRATSVRMSSELRMLVDMRVIHGQQGPWQELYESFPQPAVYGVVQVNTAGKPIVLAAESTTLALVIDVMLGGSGGARVARSKFTDIDLALIRRLFDRWTVDLEEQWQRVSNETFTVMDLETEQFAANVVPPSEPTVSFTVELRFGTSSATLGVLCPHSSIEHLVEDLVRGNYRLGSDGPMEDADTRQSLGSVDIDLRAEMIELPMRYGDLSEVQVGDRLPLPLNWDENVTVYAEGEPLYRARPGRSGNFRAIEVVEAWVDEDELGIQD